MKKSLWTAAFWMACAVGAAAQSPSSSAPFPGRAVRVVVGYPPGSAVDAALRRVAPRWSAELGQPITIENRPGASGAIAADAVARASADGYTLFAATVNEIAINGPAGAQMAIDPGKDLTPVGILFSTQPLLLARPGSAIEYFPDLVRQARAQPKRLNWATVNAFQSVLLDAVQKTAGIELNVISYKGTQQALTDLLGGQIDGMIGYPAEMAQHAQAGKLKAVAVFGKARHPLLPRTQTLAEAAPSAQDISDLTVWGGIFAPVGTPPEAVQALHRALATALGSAEIRESAAKAGYEVQPLALPELHRFIDRELALWSRFVQASGFRLQPN